MQGSAAKPRAVPLHACSPGSKLQKRLGDRCCPYKCTPQSTTALAPQVFLVHAVLGGSLVTAAWVVPTRWGATAAVSGKGRLPGVGRRQLLQRAAHHPAPPQRWPFSAAAGNACTLRSATGSPPPAGVPAPLFARRLLRQCVWRIGVARSKLSCRPCSQPTPVTGHVNSTLRFQGGHLRWQVYNTGNLLRTAQAPSTRSTAGGPPSAWSALWKRR